MKVEFDVNEVHKNNIELLNCQVELILKSLEFYAYTYQFIYPRSGKSQTKEENLRVSMVCDTYEQIFFCLDKPYTRNSVVLDFIRENHTFE